MTSIDVNALTETLSDLRDALPESVRWVNVGVHLLDRFAFNSVPSEQRHFPANPDRDSGEFWAKDLVTDHGTITFYTRDAPIACDPALDEAAWGSQVAS